MDNCKYKEAVIRCSMDLEDRIAKDMILMTGRIDIEILHELLETRELYLASLKEVEPIEVDENNFCGVCNDWVGFQGYGPEYKYCKTCGTKIKWVDAAAKERNHERLLDTQAEKI